MQRRMAAAQRDERFSSRTVNVATWAERSRVPIQARRMLDVTLGGAP
jgi:hypothetical protein